MEQPNPFAQEEETGDIASVAYRFSIKCFPVVHGMLTIYYVHLFKLDSVNKQNNDLFINELV